MTVRPLLVLAVGNPSRGDDALGPLFLDALAARLDAAGLADEVELLGDHQLQVEHALDLVDRARVLFVDASADAAAPCTLRPAVATPGAGPSTHALAPGAVLAAAIGLGHAPPPSWVLAIRGEQFALGAPLGPTARRHLDAAVELAWAWAFPGDTRRGWRLEVEGIVQGVGMRSWAWREAVARGLTGAVRNTGRGLAVDLWGPDAARVGFVGALQGALPPGARVEEVGILPLAGEGPPDFRIDASEGAAAGRLSLSPDVGICPACLAEVSGEGRFSGYPLTSCV
jgi:hydrogenase maturation protease